ncbi:MAG: acyltransferase [Desulfomicrobiaceae bacterium]|nr:acyltransferase [Desulfomicrobiaceae bacterium]
MNARAFGLDLMRAAAIALVLIAHAGAFVLPFFPAAADLFVFCGYLGVELFFVLSGYLVGGIALREISAPRPRLILRFWLRRWWRTLPPYWAALALVFLFAPGLHLPVEPWWRYAGFLQNLAWPHPPFFGEAWSLAVEEWFYLVLPAFLWVGAPRNLGRRLAVTLAGFCLLRLAVALAQDPAWDEGVRKIVLLRLDAILWGVAVAWMARTQGPRLRARALPAAGAGLTALAAAAALFFVLSRDHSLAARSLLFTLTNAGAALLLPALAALPRPQAPLAHAVETTSRISYVLYLIHHTLVLGALRVLLPPATPLAAAAGLGLYVLLSIHLARALHTTLERPLLALRDRWVPPRR